MEFLLECPTADELFSRSEKIALRGLIDFLWEDTEGKRHLLGIALDPETKASSGRKRHRGLHPLGRLILGACALQRQTGNWPVRVVRYDLLSGTVDETAGEGLPHDEVLGGVGRAIAELLRQAL